MMIDVTYELYVTPWSINQKLVKLHDVPIMSLDIETQGLYSKIQRKEALKLLDQDMDLYNHRLASIVANNDGLSYPSLIKTTHFVFGMSRGHSVLIIPPSDHMEIMIWNWIRNHRGKFLIHNTLFDLKVMYHRVGDLPHDYEDTALMAKCLINNSDAWRAKVGLKEQMGHLYKSAWSLYDQYEPEDPKDPNFLEYAAIDGAATVHLYELIMEEA